MPSYPKLRAAAQPRHNREVLTEYGIRRILDDEPMQVLFDTTPIYYILLRSSTRILVQYSTLQMRTLVLALAIRTIPLRLSARPG